MKNIFRIRSHQTMDTAEMDEGRLPEPVEESVPAWAQAEGAEPDPEKTPELPRFQPGVAVPEPETLSDDAPGPNSVPAQAFDYSPSISPGTELAEGAAEEACEPVSRAAEVTRPSAASVAGLETDNGWAAGYVIPGMEGILLEIQTLEKSIRGLEQRKAELKRKVSERAGMRDALLTGGGPALKRAVQQIFSELGVSVTPGPVERMDLVLEHRGLDFVSQIVSCEGAITLTDIRQLNHRVEEFIEVNGRQPKGLLIANTFARLPLTERDTNGHSGFPQELRLLAEERYKFCLLTTPQLFVAYCKFKRDQLDINEFITELFETVWVYGNHRDYERFRMDTGAN